MCDDVLEEILSGPCSETCGCSQCTWNEGNACYSCCRCAPCCGGPDVVGVICCCCDWSLCCCCTSCKLYSASLHQTCSWWPHIYLGMYCWPCMMVFTRYNLRLLSGIPGNMCGDFYCCCYCCCCACCQMLRSVDPKAWRLHCFCPEITVSNAYYFL